MILSLAKSFLLLALVFSSASIVHAEVIDTFYAEYTIAPTAEVSVVETITYNFDGARKHGIFRTIVNKHPQGSSEWYKARSIELAVVSVTRAGVDEPFAVERFGKELEIKIGDPDIFVEGIQTYVITYTLTGALSYGEQGAEFYYNVTGNDWEVPIKLAVATVQSEALAEKYYCYQGVSGSTESCTNSMKDPMVVTFTANNLEPGSGLTIAAEFNPALVVKVVNEQTTWLLFGYILAGLWGIILLVFIYWFRRSNYTYKTVVVEYEPYKNFLPMYTGYLFDNQLDPRDISAGILYLAEQGYIKITKTTKKVLLIISVDDYDITLLRPLSELPTKFLTQVSGLLFQNETTVGSVVPLSTLAKKRAKNAEVIMKLRQDLATDIQDSGFLESTYPSLAKLAPKILVTLALLFGGFVYVPNGTILIVVVFTVTIIMGLIMLIPRKTESWYEAKNHTAGFKLFLSVTDKDRFDFHNAPEKSPELFMQYLPYAVALGVEGKWAKVFEDITIPQPDWYDGGNIAAFSAGALTSDLSAFSTALSTNSGVSGSSGGGSSGGGGGGGGGGSW